MLFFWRSGWDSATYFRSLHNFAQPIVLRCCLHSWGLTYTRGLKNMPPAYFLRTAVRRPVRILNLSTQNKTPPAGYAKGVFFWRSGWDSTRALKNSPPDCFCPACGRVVLFVPSSSQAPNKKHTNLRLVCFHLVETRGIEPLTS